MRQTKQSTRDDDVAHAQREVEPRSLTPAQEQAPVVPATDTVDPTILGDRHAWHSTSAPVRTAAILQLQRTHGNAYTRQVVQELRGRTASGAPAVQRDTPTGGTKTKATVRVRVEAEKQGTITFDAYAVQFGQGALKEKPDLSSLQVTKEIGPESEQLRRAMLQGERLKSVTVEVLRTNDQGQQEVAQTFTISEALVASLQYSSGENNMEVVEFSASPPPKPEQPKKPEGK